MHKGIQWILWQGFFNQWKYLISFILLIWNIPSIAKTTFLNSWYFCYDGLCFQAIGIRIIRPDIVTIKGSKDYLRGLKENVIIGKLIPAGSVLRRKKQRQQQAIQNALLEESYMNYNFEEYDQMEDPIEIEDTDMDF